MTGSPFSFLSSKFKGRTWPLSLDSLRRRVKTCRQADTPSISAPQSSEPSSTTSSFSAKKPRLFSKKSTWNLKAKVFRRRRDSRDDFGNRWSKIYLPGHSRSATPLPNIYHPKHPVRSSADEEAEEEENQMEFESIVTHLGYLEMMRYQNEDIIDDKLFEPVFGNPNSPYLRCETPSSQTFSWMSRGSSLNLSSSRPPTRSLPSKISDGHYEPSPLVYSYEQNMI